MRYIGCVLTFLGGCNGASDESVLPAPFLDDLPAARALENNPALKACVASHLGTTADQTIQPDQMQSLLHLDCIDEGITSIEGLQIFENLQTLSLWENNVDDLSPLEGLSQLKWLELGHNAIREIGPLEGLTQVERLGLSSNDLVDITPIQGMAKLQWLHLDNNAIQDISPIEDLKALTWVTIEHNNVENSEALTALRAAGADVYFENQTPLADPSVGAGYSDRRSINELSLSPTVDAMGHVTFDALVDGTVYPVRTEFPGEVLAVGDRLVLEHDGVETPIGWSNGAVANLCANGEHCTVSVGVKEAPADAYDGLRPAPVISLALNAMARPNARTNAYGQADESLVPYVLASPNQFDAGSCLFMTTTGALELLIHQHTDLDTVEYNGDTDLSERFLMTAYQDVPSSTIRYWLTDTVYTYNHFGGSLLNRDYPFTAGYVRETSSGLVPCDADDAGAYYSCSYNWFDERPNDWASLMVDTPPVERTVAFADPDRSESSQWNVGLMDNEDVEKIKYMLRTRKAPVVVIYNHYLYWHADLIVGYDDTVPTEGCPMVESSMDHFDDEGASNYTRRIEAHMDRIGPCTDTGIFYVRDSIYDGGSDEQMYEYSDGFSEKYSKRIVERSYNWVKYLGNHAYSIHRK